MQRAVKSKKVDDVTPQEKANVEEFYKAKAEGKTKKSSLEEFLKELRITIPRIPIIRS
ncbi:MAG: hypothetical protein WCC52_09365 [Nitrosotalea sp.]